MSCYKLFNRFIKTFFLYNSKMHNIQNNDELILSLLRMAYFKLCVSILFKLIIYAFSQKKKKKL